MNITEKRCIKIQFYKQAKLKGWLETSWSHDIAVVLSMKSSWKYSYKLEALIDNLNKKKQMCQFSNSV